MENQEESNKNQSTTQTTTNDNKTIEEESTPINIDDKIMEFQNKLEEIISLKNEGNLFTKSAIFDEAIEKYQIAKEIINDLDKFFSEFLSSHVSKEENLKNLHLSYTKEKIAIYSNLALIYTKQEKFDLSLEHDIKVKFLS